MPQEHHIFSSADFTPLCHSVEQHQLPLLSINTLYILILVKILLLEEYSLP